MNCVSFKQKLDRTSFYGESAEHAVSSVLFPASGRWMIRGRVNCVADAFVI
jgi:hypothetical protein